MYEDILKMIKPTEEEIKEIKIVIENITSSIYEITKSMDPRIRIEHVGSTTRGTFLRDKKDIDIFIILPLEYSKDQMKGIVTHISENLLKSRVIERYELNYAEHPYSTMYQKGYAIDLVPCYSIKKIEDMISSVDRTPFHNEYIKSRLSDKQKDEVLLLKAFLRSIGVYGAEAKVNGFSGYLCELLIIYYGDFESTIKNVCEWKLPVLIDIEGHGKIKDEKLVVVDPVDPKRNVASAVSLESLSKFISACKVFKKYPSERFFIPSKRRADKDISKRGTDFVFLLFKIPRISMDILYPQLKKARERIADHLREEDFVLIRSDFWTDEKKVGIITLELENIELSSVKRHIGPRVYDDFEFQENFIKKHLNKESTLSGPWIEGERWVVEKKRSRRNAIESVKDALKKDLGKHLTPFIRESKIFLNDEIFHAKVDLEFLEDYLSKTYHWLEVYD